MSRDYNRVIISGRLARDPDVRFTQNKTKTARITVAVGSQWKDKVSGEKKESVDFTPVVCWSFCADICEKYLKKGSHVLIEGRISTRDFDDAKTGTHKWVTEVIAESIFMLGSKNDSDGVKTQQTSGVKSRSNISDSEMKILREETGMNDEFPLDFSELPHNSGDIEIPF